MPSRVLYQADGNDNGPTWGVAELEGEPVWFERVFDEEADEYSDEFKVTRLPSEAVEVALETERLFERWLGEFNAGKVPLETHPALPDDREAMGQLDRQLDIWRSSGAAGTLRVTGSFVRVWAESAQLGKGWLIQWRTSPEGTP